METRIGGEAHQFYRMRGSASDMRMLGKRTLEWNLNDWKWDGDLFLATPMNSMPTAYSGQQLFPIGSSIPVNEGFSNSSSSCSDEMNLELEKRKREMEMEKRRRVIVIEDDNSHEEPGTLSLKLGGHGHGSERGAVNWEGSNGKKTKLVGSSSNRIVCQVGDCNSDLSSAKDYHRRHKVCELHSKATRALVGNVMQRFCQQCSRFHVLQEFDEGKRSCRRRLAGHNKRRRKTQPDAPANGNAPCEDQANGYLLMSLLKILSNMHSNKSDQTKDHDLLTQLLKNIASNPQAHAGTNISGLLNDRTIGNAEIVSALLANGFHGTQIHQHVTATGPSSLPPQNGGASADDVTPSADDVTPQPSVAYPMKESPPGYSDVRGSTGGQAKLTNFDLNDVYIDSDDGTEDLERSPVPANAGPGSFGRPVWLQQDSQRSSPPQASGNSDSASAPSPSSSSGEDQSRTDRIVFKLFGKEPNDFPVVLRAQILNWLSHSPTDIESYIRPGCVVLTIYLRLAESEWDELCCDLSSSLSRLLDASEDTFWKTGWVYIRVQDQIAFIYDGRVILDASVPFTSYSYSDILSVTPIAISASEKAQFTIKGLNLSKPSTRLLCALEGKYHIQENNHELVDSTDSLDEHDEFQCINFSCSIPTITGRGFFEVEDNDLSSSFLPFIVAENEICSEIRMLENVIDLPDTDEDFAKAGKLEARTQAIDFLYEMGWLLNRSQLKSRRLGQSDPNTDLFSLRRFKWLMYYSMDRDWCAVVKKLLDIMVNGTVSLGEYLSLKGALAEMGLLHRAVRKNSRALVHLLLRYRPEKGDESLLFMPDTAGPAGLTPLHIAAGRDGSENVLDALLDDPGSVGIKAWKNARDSTGSTPEDYARVRGHYSYIHLFQKKLNKKPGQVTIDIPGTINSVFEIEKLRKKPVQRNCKQCDNRTRTGYGNISRSSLVYRPAMLSMVAIAAVCVCVALLFKSSPEVLFVFRPFCWEMLDYGSS